jgi:hypothetical protein
MKSSDDPLSDGTDEGVHELAILSQDSSEGRSSGNVPTCG